MKVLREAFDKLYEQIENPKIDWRKFEIDPNDPVVINTQAEIGPDRQIILEGYEIQINQIDKSIYHKYLNTLIENFFNEVILNLESPIPIEELYSHCNFLMDRFEKADEQITKTRNRYKLRKFKIDEDYQVKHADELQSIITNYFYEQRLIVRKIINRLYDISKNISKQIETKLEKILEKMLDPKNRLN